MLQVKEESGQSCVVAGNSLGGFTALYAAASEAATSGTGNLHQSWNIKHSAVSLVCIQIFTLVYVEDIY